MRQVVGRSRLLFALARGFSVTIALYKSVFGYGISDMNLDEPSQSQPIIVTPFEGSSQITTQDTVQFFNAESPGSTTLHSVYRFKGGAFSIISIAGTVADCNNDRQPRSATTYRASAGALTQRAISGVTCFSPEFRLYTRIYDFGGYDYYNSTNF